LFVAAVLLLWRPSHRGKRVAKQRQDARDEIIPGPGGRKPFFRPYETEKRLARSEMGGIAGCRGGLFGTSSAIGGGPQQSEPVMYLFRKNRCPFHRRHCHLQTCDGLTGGGRRIVILLPSRRDICLPWPLAGRSECPLFLLWLAGREPPFRSAFTPNGVRRVLLGGNHVVCWSGAHCSRITWGKFLCKRTTRSRMRNRALAQVLSLLGLSPGFFVMAAGARCHISSTRNLQPRLARAGVSYCWSARSLPLCSLPFLCFLAKKKKELGAR